MRSFFSADHCRRKHTFSSKKKVFCSTEPMPVIFNDFLYRGRTILWDYSARAREGGLVQVSPEGAIISVVHRSAKLPPSLSFHLFYLADILLKLLWKGFSRTEGIHGESQYRTYHEIKRALSYLFHLTNLLSFISDTKILGRTLIWITKIRNVHISQSPSVVWNGPSLVCDARSDQTMSR